nr:MAG TPA: hypothetical protein [Caudoviricetes sp.]DAS03923.1 MAG TPA: hypothetical protein [Bacteriophage sp.]DAV43342.1 MAG TPA: hypothetical protein [Caudoviricetes sp.]DAW42774.1 MAG TPA: hypothetical protein [Caudoviricetes sp.]
MNRTYRGFAPYTILILFYIFLWLDFQHHQIIQGKISIIWL